MFEMLAKCEECSTNIEVNSSTIRKEEVVSCDDNKMLIIIYYDCPTCGRRHIVQIDDIITSKLLRELTKMIGKASRKKKRHDLLTDKEVTKINKTRADLAAKRFELMKTYQGKSYRMGNEILEFKVSMQYEPKSK